VVTLLGLLAFWHVRAHVAALAGLLVAGGIAILSIDAAFAGGSIDGLGAAFGLFPIGWIVLNAIFIYNLSVERVGLLLQRQVSVSEIGGFRPCSLPLALARSSKGLPDLVLRWRSAGAAHRPGLSSTQAQTGVDQQHRTGGVRGARHR
jgi:hypothetical protein